MTIVLIVVVMLALFSLAFVTKRRFGVLGLSLAAGVVLSQNASTYVAQFYSTNQLPVAPLSFQSAAAITLIIVPALILLIGGPKYTTKKAALIGATGFALLGTFFLIGPLTASLPPAEPAMRDILQIVASWESLIVVVALILALVDTFMVHGLSHKKTTSKKH